MFGEISLIVGVKTLKLVRFLSFESSSLHFSPNKDVKHALDQLVKTNEELANAVNNSLEISYLLLERGSIQIGVQVNKDFILCQHTTTLGHRIENIWSI